jgi:LysR family cyn operon transcriptional activator
MQVVHERLDEFSPVADPDYHRRCWRLCPRGRAVESQPASSVTADSGRTLQLTLEGEEIVRRGRRLLQEAESLRDRAEALKAGVTGILRVGASPQQIETVLAPFVGRFRRRHPGIEVHFVEEGGARINDRLERGEVQMVLTTVNRGLFSGRLLYPIYVLAVVATSGALGRRAAIDVSELADEPLLMLQRSFASRGWFDAACHNADVSPPIVLESAAPATLMALARNGDGVAIVPSNVSVPSKNVKAMPVMYRGTPIGHWAFVAWDRRRFFPSYARQFIDELVAHVHENFPGRDIAKKVQPIRQPKLSERAIN